jgi:hypothetical protein
MLEDLYWGIIWSGIGFAIVNVGFIVALVAHHYWLTSRDHLRRCVEERWKDVFSEVRWGEDPSIPDRSDREYPVLLSLWTAEFQRAECETQKLNLIDFAGEIGLEEHVGQQFEDLRENSDPQVVLALGYLRWEEFWEELADLAREGNALFSVLAARAMMEIDPSLAFDDLQSVLHERTDWPLVHLKAILDEVEMDIATRRIPDLVLGAPTDRKADLVPMLGWVRTEVARDSLRSILEEETDEEVLAAALRSFVDLAQPEDRRRVRPLLDSDAYFLRAQAARVLGDIGNEEDVDPLVERTADSNYWVRKRAAGALASLPGMTAERLRKIRDRAEDSYAKDILDEVINREDGPWTT